MVCKATYYNAVGIIHTERKQSSQNYHPKVILCNFCLSALPVLSVYVFTALTVVCCLCQTSVPRTHDENWVDFVMRGPLRDTDLSWSDWRLLCMGVCNSYGFEVSQNMPHETAVLTYNVHQTRDLSSDSPLLSRHGHQAV